MLASHVHGIMSSDMFQCVDHMSENDATALHSIMCSLATYAYVLMMQVLPSPLFKILNNSLR